MHSVGLLEVKRSTDPACQSPTSAPVERGPLTVSHHAEPPAPRPPAQWRGVRRALLPPEGLPRRQVEATAGGHLAPIAGTHWHRSDPVLPGALGSTQPRHTSVGTSNGSPAPGAPGATKPKTHPARSRVPFGSIPLPEPSPAFLHERVGPWADALQHCSMSPSTPTNATRWPRWLGSTPTGPRGVGRA